MEEIPKSFIFNLSLVQKYVDSYILEMNNKDSNFLVHHLINYLHNYSILIFKSSICTYPLIKYGYYYIDSQNLAQKLSKSSNIDINNFVICFITYNEKSNLLLINQNDKTFLDIINECPQCSDDNLFSINNNFTSEVALKPLQTFSILLFFRCFPFYLFQDNTHSSGYYKYIGQTHSMSPAIGINGPFLVNLFTEDA
jgi:hypothetical protein